jgi:hypothetical protein
LLLHQTCVSKDTNIKLTKYIYLPTIFSKYFLVGSDSFLSVFYFVNLSELKYFAASPQRNKLYHKVVFYHFAEKLSEKKSAPTGVLKKSSKEL